MSWSLEKYSIQFQNNLISIGPDIVRSCLRNWFPMPISKPGKKVLELGPGTGQATEPILNTGCDYYAIELGGNLADMMKENTESLQTLILLTLTLSYTILEIRDLI